MSGISLTASMRSNLLSLQNIASQQDIVQNRLATGLKVSSAIDNPSSYYTASSLSNRAADLTALLDAMSQGIQTIKAASEAIDSGTKFLEQAKAVANQALETSGPTVSREWLSRQSGVGAVVESKEELLRALNDVTGKIVIFGQIDMGDDNIVLKEGQSLVGVGYFADVNPAARDSELNKFSQLNFNFSGNNSGITLADNALVSDLSVNVSVAQRGSSYADSGAVYGRNVNGVVLQNLDITVDTEQDSDTKREYAAITLPDSKAEYRGKINIREVVADPAAAKSYKTYGIFCGDNYFADGTVVNVSTYSYAGFGMIAGSQYLSGNAQVNVQTHGQYATAVGYGKVSLQDNSQFNIRTFNRGGQGFEDIDVILDGKSKVNFYSSEISGVGFASARINMLSAAAVMNINAAYSSAATFRNTTVTTVAGAVINTKEGSFRADTVLTGAAIANGNNVTGFKQTSTTPVSLPEDYDDIFTKIDDGEKSAIKKDEGMQKYSAQFNRILEQYDHLIGDASYKGVNLLLQQNLKVNFNEDRSSQIEVKGVDGMSMALGVNRADWATTEDIETSISELDEAIGILRSYASAFGNYYSIVTTREDFTGNLINVLEEGADKLTLADMNQESANMLALQTAQQLAVNSLSLASQASQSILRLF